MAVALAFLLAGCSPAERSAIRLNADGTIDFVSCVAVDGVSEASATTSFRSGPNGQVDDSTAVSVDLHPSIDHLDAGQGIEFVGVPGEWDRLDIYVKGSSSSDATFGHAERDNLTVGQWRWMDEDGILPSRGKRCDIVDPED